MQPRFTKKAVLDFEQFDIESGTWKNIMNVECKIVSKVFFWCIPRCLSCYHYAWG